MEDTLRQWPLRDGRQLVQGRPALEHEHPIQRPLPLQRQQTGIFALVNDSTDRYVARVRIRTRIRTRIACMNVCVLYIALFIHGIT